VLEIFGRRDFLNNLTVKHCDNMEKLKTILVSKKQQRRFDVRLASLSFTDVKRTSKRRRFFLNQNGFKFFHIVAVFYSYKSCPG